MHDPRALVILLRFGLGLALLCMAVGCGVGYCVAKADALIAGAGISAAVTFATGIWFCNQALDPELWAPLKPTSDQLVDPDDTVIE